MTEEEAQSKWCPFARLLAHTYSQDGQGRSYEGGYSYNRSPDSDDDRGPHMPGGSLCIASACMAWRWKPGWGAQPGELIREIKAYRDRHDTSLVEAKNAVEAEYRSQVGQGYCGLAGAPQ